MRKMCIAAVVSAAGLACVAQGQLSDTLTNGSFELTWQQAGRPVNARPGDIFGFTDNNDPSADVSTLYFHTGQRSMTIGAIAGNAFHGYTTDTLDSMPPNFTFLYYDVPVSWQLGDLVWSVWFMIPADQSLGEPPTPNWPVDANPGQDFMWPEGFAPASMKIDVKGAGNGFQNNAAYDGWNFGFQRDVRAQASLQWGTTNGIWNQRTITWPARTATLQGWKDQVESNAAGNYSLPAPGTWPNPPAGQTRWPDRAKITFGRFNPTATASGGAIYYDDFTFTQLPAGPAPCGPADVGGQGGVPGADGVLDNNDFIVFIDYFFANNPLADRGIQGGVAGSDGSWDNNDFIVFIDQFFSGCAG
ncbi:MAG: GC-type dockerin domain-anchored protein [Phycisphaerales bacterium]|nr:GC-type dockerin domain-anchored protein [Phycisphaerales bacterium]